MEDLGLQARAMELRASFCRSNFFEPKKITGISIDKCLALVAEVVLH